jgi:hypothetical protein
MAKAHPRRYPVVDGPMGAHGATAPSLRAPWRVAAGGDGIVERSLGAAHRSGLRRALSLLPPVQAWLDEVDQLASENRDHRRRQMATPTDQAAVVGLMSCLTPRRAVGVRKLRMGGEGDGGYVMLDDFAGIGGALSFGIGPDCSWDAAVAERGIPVHQYDHTVEGPPTPHPGFRFFRTAIGAQPGEGCESLDSATARLAAPGAGRLLLKADIEGAEWEMFDAATEAELARFSQIVVEFHHLHRVLDTAWRARAERVLRKLRTRFEVVHVHGNNAGPHALIGQVPVPDIFEVSYVNSAIYRCEDTDEIFPTPLDRPSVPGRAELFLGSMRFR